MGGARIGVYDEHEIFRLGVVACLSQDPSVAVINSQASAADHAADLDLAITSTRLAGRFDFGCGVLICMPELSVPPVGVRNPVRGLLPRSSLTAEQLLAAVHAALAGLSVEVHPDRIEPLSALDDRCCEVLRMLADGASTAEISQRLYCSERTVKAIIADLKQRLHARNRAHVVASGIRRGVI